MAKSFHREAGFEWEPHLDHAVRQAVRSITRGMGPSSAKLDVPLELCDSQFASRISEAYETLRVPEDHRIDFPDDTGRFVVYAQQFARMSPFREKGWLSSPCRFQRTTLPVAGATDPMSASVFASMTRAVAAQVMKLSCLLPCSAVSVGPLATPFVYTMQLFAYQWLFGPKVWNATAPFFGNGSGPPTKSQVSWLARAFAWALCSQDLHDWPTEVIQRWSQHTF